MRYCWTAPVLAMLIAGVVAVSTALTAFGAPFDQAAQVTFAIPPPASSVRRGETIAVELQAQLPAESNLGAWQVDVAFDNTVLAATGCTPTAGGACNATYATRGTTSIVRFVGAVTCPGIIGATSLGAITFQAIGAAGSATAISPIVADASAIADCNVIQMSASTSPGTVAIAAGTPSPNASSSATAPPTPAAPIPAPPTLAPPTAAGPAPTLPAPVLPAPTLPATTATTVSAGGETGPPAPPARSVASGTPTAVRTAIGAPGAASPRSSPISATGGPPPGSAAPVAAPPVLTSVLAGSGTSVAPLFAPGIGAIDFSLPPNSPLAASAAVPEQVQARLDPAPAGLSTVQRGALGGGIVQPIGGPIALTLQTFDAATQAARPIPAELGSLPVQVRLPIPPPAQARLLQDPAAQFSWLRELRVNGEFAGYLRVDAAFEPASGTLLSTITAADLAGTLFLPAMIVPASVQNFDPAVHIWGGPTSDAPDFGPAGTQFTTFAVVAPQIGSRLYVYNTATGNYGWIDVDGVGPAS